MPQVPPFDSSDHKQYEQSASIARRASCTDPLYRLARRTFLPPRYRPETAQTEIVRKKIASNQKHYLFKVLRLKEKSNVYLFNGSDGEWKSVIIRDNINELLCEEQIRPQSNENGPWLFFSLIKFSNCCLL